jgi:hypothetical protein
MTNMTTESYHAFLRDGYTLLQPDLPATLHARIRERLALVLQQEYNPGNNILPAVPELHSRAESGTHAGAG